MHQHPRIGGPSLQCTCHLVCLSTATAHSHTKGPSIEWAKLLSDQTRLCKRHYTRCKPSRRKSPLGSSIAEIWTMFSKLMVCLHGFVHKRICTDFLRDHRTKQSGVSLKFWVILFSLAIFLPFQLCEADPHLQPSPPLPSDQLLSVVAPVGSAFVYAIPERAFDCKVDKFVVSETADRFLSPWLAYDDDKRQVYGVPSEKDIGTLNILVVALTKSEIENGGRICGSKSFAITVISLSDELPVSANLADPSRADPLDFQQTDAATNMLCTPGMQVVLGTVLVSVNIDSLNGHERMSTILKMGGHLNTSTNKVRMFSDESPHPLIQQLEKPSLLVAGPGDGRFAKGPKSSLTWRITCGAIGLRDAALSQLEASTQDGTVSGLLGFPVVSWHVMSGTQKSIVRHRVRRNVGGRCLGCTPTPSTSSVPPTRISNVSTTVIVNKTMSSIVTSSTIVSVTPAVNSTVFSRSMAVSSRTISPSPSMNATVQASTSSMATRNSSVFSSSSVPASVSSSVAVMSSSVILPSPSSPNKTFSPTSFTGSSISVTFSSESGNSSTLSSSTPVVTNSTHVTPGTLAVTPTLPATRNVSIATSTAANETVVTHSLPLISTSRAQSTRTLFALSTLISATPTRSVDVSRVSTVTISVLTNVNTSTMSAKSSSPAGTLSSSEMAFSSSLSDSKMFNSTSATPVDSSTVVKVSSPLISSPVSLTTESFIPTESQTTSLMANSTSGIPATSTSFKLATSISSEMRGTTTLVTRTVRNTSTFASPTSTSAQMNVSSSRESTRTYSQVTNSTVDSKITSISTVAVMSTRMQSAITRSTSPAFESTARTSFPVSLSSLVTTADATRSVDANLTSLRATHSTLASTRSSVTAVNSSLVFPTQPVETSFPTTGLKTPSSGSVTDVTKVTSETQSSPGASFITPTTAASATGPDSTKGLFSPSSLVNETSTPTVTRAASFDVTSLTTDILTSTGTTSTILSRKSSLLTSVVSTKTVTASTSVTTSPSLNASVTQSRIVTQGSISSLFSQSLLSSASQSHFTLPLSHVTYGASYTTVHAFSIRPTVTIFTPSSLTVSSVTSRKASSSGVTLASSDASVVPSRVHTNTTITSVHSLRASSGPVISSSVTRQVPSSHSTSVITKLKSSTEHAIFTSPVPSASYFTPVPSSLRTSVITELAYSTEHPIFTSSVSSASYSSPVSSSTSTSIITKLASSTEHPIFTSQVTSASYSSPVSSSHSTSIITKLTSSTEHPIFTSQVPSSVSPPFSQQSSKSTQLVSSVTSVSFVVGATSLGVPSSVLTSTVTTTSTTSFTPTPTTIVQPTTAPPNSGPVLVNNLGRVTAQVGKALNYPIPNDTFYDQEDGNTWNLKLRVALLDNKTIPRDYWLQFDPRERRLYGLPSEKDADAIGASGKEFILVASDKQGKKAYDAFDVLIDTDSPPVVQQLSIRTTNNYSKFNADVSLRLQLLDEIAAYYGDSDNSNIRVISISPGSVIFVWTNDSLPTAECDVEKADYIANKVFLEDGEVKQEFKQALEPNFPVLTASEGRLGACNATDVTPTGPILGKVSKSVGDLWYMHVLTGILAVVLLIIIAVLLVRWLRRPKPKPFKPEKRTYKKRKPIILSPEIELKEFPGKPLVLPNDDPSQPPSYMSETSLDRSAHYYVSDEEDYAKRSPSPPIYEPPPPFYPAMEEPRSLPPPMYALPPLLYKK